MLKDFQGVLELEKTGPIVFAAEPSLPFGYGTGSRSQKTKAAVRRAAAFSTVDGSSAPEADLPGQLPSAGSKAFIRASSSMPEDPKRMHLSVFARLEDA